MIDARLRELERRAAIGDEGARKRLLAARLRDGLDELHYELLGANTYGRALHRFREVCNQSPDEHLQSRIVLDGKKVVRPFTFKETLEKRLCQYHNAATKERWRLFNSWNDTCTGIAYKGKTSKFKIIPTSEHLLRLDPRSHREVIPITYDRDFAELPELNSEDATCGQVLSKSDVIVHPAWLAAVEQDNDLLQTYADVVYFELDRRGRDTGMVFNVVKTPDKDHLRALFVYNLGTDSMASGYRDLVDTRFVRVTQREVTEELDYDEDVE